MMTGKTTLVVPLLTMSCLVFAVRSQHQAYTTPVPILKQIDRHNDDGSYTYGFEAADKSFKIETKYPNGEVFGKYGYLDDQGKVREIEYGASKRGFEPAGSDINVPPPTLTNSHPYPLGANEIDDGQYREDPSVYFKDQKYARPVAASKFSLSNYQTSLGSQHQPQPGYIAPVQQYAPPAPQSTHAPHLQPQPYYHTQQPQQPPPQQQQQQYYQQQPYYQPSHNYQRPAQPGGGYSAFPNHLHPAVKNLDIWTGSYSIDYTGRK